MKETMKVARAEVRKRGQMFSMTSGEVSEQSRVREKAGTPESNIQFLVRFCARIAYSDPSEMTLTDKKVTMIVA